MIKKISIIGFAIFVAIAGIIFSLSNDNENETAVIAEEPINGDVIMPTKSSRPGCEETDSCYIPSTVRIIAGDKVTWLNEDVAFHSVTSGSYDEPKGLFDSGHIDPGRSFTFSFDTRGEYDYFCTLHPWMKGVVIVEN